jgi:hypothetical protein
MRGIFSRSEVVYVTTVSLRRTCVSVRSFYTDTPQRIITVALVCVCERETSRKASSKMTRRRPAISSHCCTKMLALMCVLLCASLCLHRLESEHTVSLSWNVIEPFFASPFANKTHFQHSLLLFLHCYTHTRGDIVNALSLSPLFLQQQHSLPVSWPTRK